MEFKEINKNPFEQRKRKIIKDINQRKENILKVSDYENLVEELKEIDQSPTEDLLTRKKEIKQIIKNATVFLKSLPEFQFALEQLDRIPEKTLHTMAHENAHLNKAEELGAKPKGYKLIILRNSKGKFVLQPKAVYTAGDWNEEEELDNKIEITRAPEDYGNILSSKDVMKLNELNNKKLSNEL